MNGKLKHDLIFLGEQGESDLLLCTIYCIHITYNTTVRDISSAALWFAFFLFREGGRIKTKPSTVPKRLKACGTLNLIKFLNISCF